MVEEEEKKGKRRTRNLMDNASNLLTNLLSGGSNLGSMPTAEGAVSDLFGKPLFFSLYDWFLEVLLLNLTNLLLPPSHFLSTKFLFDCPKIVLHFSHLIAY